MRLMRDILNEIDPQIREPGEVIKNLRRLTNMSQVELGKITGLKQSVISAIESGKITMTVHYAQILGAGLGTGPITILFPNGREFKSKEVKEIEKKFEAFTKKKKMKVSNG